MSWQLVPLHAPGDPPTALPEGGVASVGRRPNNTVLCKDLAVSGQHCLMHCRGGEVEVEDCSTNGTFVNEAKLSKGQRQMLQSGDVISLTKPPEEESGSAAVAAPLPPRVQFRLELLAPPADFGRERPPSGLVEVTIGGGPPSVKAVEAPVSTPVKAFSSTHSFAQDLLVQEQQSKAKITGELLASERKLEEEKKSVEAMGHELRKVRQQVEEERVRRKEAEEGRDRLTGESEVLRSERRQLQELTAAHEELVRKFETAEAELQEKLKHCAELEKAQEQLGRDVEQATEAQQKSSQQHAELTTRARQAQERAERFEQQRAEVQREVERSLEEGSRLRRELAAETSAREQLEEEVSRSKEKGLHAGSGERSARVALDAASARRAELECQVSAAQADAEGARAALRQAEEQLAQNLRLAERLHEAGRGLATELRRRADIWEQALAEGCLDRLSDDLAAQGGPSSAQATCRISEGGTPTKSQHNEEGQEQAEERLLPSAGVPIAAAAPSEERAAEEATAAGHGRAPVGLSPLAGSSHAAEPEAPIPEEAPSAPPVPQVAEVGAAAEDAATIACLDGALGLGLDLNSRGRSRSRSPSRVDAQAAAAAPVPALAGATSAGFSTAWSLELLETDALPPPPKRQRGSED
mmetsp:Transcript_23761/g.51891  ORF Transcript_23761/g.51891 Transcript_23761/m.51891 type:complete len:642 (-) Transcript_23761:58-1983(-)